MENKNKVLKFFNKLFCQNLNQGYIGLTSFEKDTQIKDTASFEPPKTSFTGMIKRNA